MLIAGYLRGGIHEDFLQCKKFGKIDNARIDISNFAVFVGNNNSGKVPYTRYDFSQFEDNVAGLYEESKIALGMK